MNDSTNGTSHVASPQVGLEALRTFLALPEEERLAVLKELTQPEAKTLYYTAAKIERGRGREWDSPEQLYVTDPVGLAMCADFKWISEQMPTGAFKDYPSEYIAVVDQCLVGHGKDLTVLYAEVSSRLGIDPERIVIDYIEGDDDPWF